MKKKEKCVEFTWPRFRTHSTRSASLSYLHTTHSQRASGVTPPSVETHAETHAETVTMTACELEEQPIVVGPSLLLCPHARGPTCAGAARLWLRARRLVLEGFHSSIAVLLLE